MILPHLFIYTCHNIVKVQVAVKWTQVRGY